VHLILCRGDDVLLGQRINTGYAAIWTESAEA
jgi:hypothetical protein